PVLNVALTGAHADFDRLLGDRLVGEHADPHLAATLDVTADGTACRLDLARGELTVCRCLQAVLAEADSVSAPAQAVVAALVYLAVLGSLGLQHGGLPRFAGRAGRTVVAVTAVAAVATVTARTVVRLFLTNLGEI